VDQIEDFVDERQKAWCIHCGGSIALLATSRDHVPSRSLLVEPYPANLPVVQICKACNTGFSFDEEYLAAFLGAVLTGSTDPERQASNSAARILKRNVKLKAKIDRARSEYVTLGGETRIICRPERNRIDRIVLKNARGHAFYEFGEPMLEPPAHVWSAPLVSLSASQRADFQNMDQGAGWPEVSSRMLTRVLTGQDLADDWVVVQDGVYRYAVAQRGTLLVRSVLFEYLSTEVYWD
jgi:hypothetical protein